MEQSENETLTLFVSTSFITLDKEKERLWDEPVINRVVMMKDLINVLLDYGTSGFHLTPKNVFLTRKSDDYEENEDEDEESSNSEEKGVYNFSLPCYVGGEETMKKLKTMESFCYTMDFVAPELYGENIPPNERSDVFSAASLLEFLFPYGAGAGTYDLG